VRYHVGELKVERNAELLARRLLTMLQLLQKQLKEENLKPSCTCPARIQANWVV